MLKQKTTLYQVPECVTHEGDSRIGGDLIQHGKRRRFAMAAAIALREDFDALALRGLAKKTRDANQSRRLLALAEIYDGGSRGQAARIGGIGLQTIRDWVLRFNARGPDGLIDGKAPGRATKLNGAQRAALVRIVESGPVPGVHGG